MESNVSRSVYSIPQEIVENIIELSCDFEIMDKETLEKLEIKQCPGCKMGITREIGCDQMFCTVCHVPFSWKTGKILLISKCHNPYFFEWIRKSNMTNEQILEWEKNMKSRSNFKDIHAQLVKWLNNEVLDYFTGAYDDYDYSDEQKPVHDPFYVLDTIRNV